ncbi:MAG: N-acetylmuramoyl-L-alanine amidase [Spirochaetes bacterium]|nr:N-acetylmuramoyl-L-alanine amidase [Spirochaetota bacterium]
MSKKCLFIALFISIFHIYASEGAYYSVNRIISFLKLETEFNNINSALLIKKLDKTAYLSNFSNYIIIGGEKLFLNDFVTSEMGQFFIPIDGAIEILKYFSKDNYLFYLSEGDLVFDDDENVKITVEKTENLPDEFSNKNSTYKDDAIKRIKAIIIDPGHGGKDPGSVGYNGLKEKDVVLSTALILQKKIKDKYPDKTIILTRDRDVFIPLEERANIANRTYEKLGETIFISIHVNSSRSSKSYGFETWHLNADYKRDILNKNSISDDKSVANIVNAMMIEEIYKESKELAKNIQDKLEERIGYVSRNRGIKEEKYFVIKKSIMPAVLVEIGFNSNKYEAIRLTNYSYLNKIATGISDGLFKFISDYEKTKGFTK